MVILWHHLHLSWNEHMSHLYHFWMKFVLQWNQHWSMFNLFSSLNHASKSFVVAVVVNERLSGGGWLGWKVFLLDVADFVISLIKDSIILMEEWLTENPLYSVSTECVRCVTFNHESILVFLSNISHGIFAFNTQIEGFSSARLNN